MITTTGQGTFHITATGEVSQGPDERSAAGLGSSGRTFPLDGVTSTGATDLVITEIMRDPASVSDTRGEWFEVHNPGSSPVDIEGWTIRDDDSDSHVISHGGPLDVPPGGFLVLGRNGDPSQNGDYHADYVYSGINLANGNDELELVGQSGVVDRVPIAGSGWPTALGKSMQLQDVTANNANAANWAPASARGGSYGGGGTDLGTPGGQ